MMTLALLSTLLTATTPAPAAEPTATTSPAPPATRLMLKGGGPPARPALTAQVASTVSALESAVAEVDVCCAGQLERAPLEAQRRWAVSLYRWLVLTGCRPDPAGFKSQGPFEAQAKRLDPGYVAVLSAHPSEWLERERPNLVATTSLARQSTPQFFSGVCVLGVFEQELRRALDKHAAAVRAAEKELRAAESSVVADRDWARQKLAESVAKGVAFDYEVAFRKQREALAAQLAEREARVKAIQDEDTDYQNKWTARYGKLAYGTLEFQKAIGEYRRVVNEHNDQLVALGGEITELQRKIDRLQGGALAVDLLDLDLPPAAPRPATAAPAVPGSPSGRAGGSSAAAAGSDGTATPVPAATPLAPALERP